MIIGVSGKIGSGKDTVGSIIQYLYYEHSDINIDNKLSYEEFVKTDRTNNILVSSVVPEIKKYADKLKDIVCILLSCTREQLEDREFKETGLSSEWDLWQLHYRNWNDKIVESFYVTKEEAINAYNSFIPNYSCEEPKLVYMTPRKLLQLLGTACGRQIIHPNIWVNATMVDYKEIYNIHNINLESSRPLKDLIKGDYPNWIITDVRFPNEAKAITKRGGINIRIQRDINKYPIVNGDGILNNYNNSQHASETALDLHRFDYIVNHGTIEALIEQVRIILINEDII